MASPARRFNDGRAEREAADDGLGLRLPASFEPPVQPAPAESVPVGPVVDQVVSATAVEVDRVVPASGNLELRGQQIWLGPARAGLPIVIWADTNHLHVLGADGGGHRQGPRQSKSEIVTAHGKLAS